MNGETLRIVLEMIGSDLTGGAFGSLAGNVMRAGYLLRGMGDDANANSQVLTGVLMPALIGAGGAFLAFTLGLRSAITAGAQLENAGAMASIAISDGAQHVGQLEDAIVKLANTSQYKIADVDMAFRVLGGLGYTTGQILGGMGEQAIILAQALGGPGAGISAADAARLLGQTLYIFAGQGLTAKQAADELTGAYYNNMMSVSDLTTFMGMAGGTASALGVNLGQLLTFGSLLTPMFGSASSAGASLSYMMRNLAHPATSKMADEIKHLGLQVYDSQGKFVGLKSIMDQLFTKTAGMTQQQKMDVFGTLFNVRSGRAAMDMMAETQAQFDSAYSRINGRITQVGQAQRDSNAINNTGIGTWQRLTTTVNDFFANAGKGIVTAIKPLLNSLNGLFSTLQNNKQFELFFAVFLVAGTILAGLAVIITAVTIAIISFGWAVAVAAGIFAGIIAIAALAGFLFVQFANHTRLAAQLTTIFHTALSVLGAVLGALGAVLGFLLAPWQAFLSGFQQGITWVGNFAGPVLKQIIGDIETFGSKISIIATAALTFLNQGLHNLGTALAGLVPIGQDFLQILQFVGMVLGVVAGYLLATLLPAIEAVGMGFVTFWDGLVALISGVVQAIFGILEILIGVFKIIFGTIIALVTGHADQAKQILIDGWNNIKSGVLDLVEGLAMALVGAFTALLGSLLAIIGGLVAGIIHFFVDLWDQLTGHSIVPDMINSIIQFAATLPGRFLAAIASLTGSVLGVFTSMGGQVLGSLAGLAGQLFTSGAHLVGNLISGIQSMAGNLAGAVGGIAGKIAGLLHHSVPSEGPLADELDWMPHMMQNLAMGIHANLPLLEDAAGRAAGTISGAFTSPSITSLQTQTVVASAAQNSGPAQQFTIPIEIDGSQVAQAVFQVVGGQLRMNGMSRIGRG